MNLRSVSRLSEYCWKSSVNLAPWVGSIDVGWNNDELFALLIDIRLFLVFLSYDKRNQSMDRKPRLIKDAFPGINAKVDAVFQHESESLFSSEPELNDPGTLRVVGLQVLGQIETFLQAPQNPEADPWDPTTVTSHSHASFSPLEK